MAIRNGGRLWLGFQWNAVSWDGLPVWGETLMTAIGPRIVHWALPAFPPDLAARKRASAARLIRLRIEKSGDAVYARGFSGACHPLLSLDELEKELAWGVKNPWATGLADIFDIRPSVLVPSQPDTLRPAAWAAYRAHGYAAIGIGISPGRDQTARPSGCFRYTRVSAAECSNLVGDQRRLRRLLTGTPDLFLMIDLTGPVPIQPLKALLESIPPAPESAAPFPTDAAAASGPACADLDWTPFPPPRLRATLNATAQLARKKRKKSEEYADLLGRMASLSAPGPIGTGAKVSAHEARLVAHMLGEVSLAGTTFDVRLAGGRFCGATRHGRDLLPRHPAQSYVRVAGRTLTFATTSSFSFEGESGTGLREELRMDGREDARLSLEYAFRDDSPFLTIAGEIRYPDLPAGCRVDEYAPLSLALRELSRGEAVKIEAAAPDESAASVTVREGSGPVFLPGASFRVPGRDGCWINLRFSAPEDRRWGLPSFRVERSRGRRVLRFNPFGSYAPVAGSVLGGTEERFTLLMNLEEGRP